MGRKNNSAAREAQFKKLKSERLVFPSLPGQPENYTQIVYEELCSECSPQNIIEDLWMQDLAWLTAQIDFCRYATLGYQEYILSKKIKNADEDFDNNKHEKMLSTSDANHLKALDQKNFKSPDGSILEDRLFLKLMGRAVQEQAQILMTIRQMEDSLRRERDRIFAQFERRRRESVRAVITSLDNEWPKLSETPNVKK